MILLVTMVSFGSDHMPPKSSPKLFTNYSKISGNSYEHFSIFFGVEADPLSPSVPYFPRCTPVNHDQYGTEGHTVRLNTIEIQTEKSFQNLIESN